MLNSIRKFLAPPVFPDDEDKTRAAFYGNWIMLVFMVLIIITEIAGKISSEDYLAFNVLDIALTILFFVLLFAREGLRRGYVNQANIIFVSLLWVLSNAAAFSGFGVRDSAFIANFIIILAAGLLLGLRAASILTIVTIVTGYGLAYAETNNLTPPAYYTISANSTIRDMSYIYVAYAIFIALLFNGWNSAIRSARRGREQIEAANRELQESHINLEENQRELLAANKQLEERTDRINAVAEISNIVASILDINHLLISAVQVVSHRFNYYHVGLYLLDDSKQSAILRAASSDGGLKMIADGHQVEAGDQNPVGYTSYNGKPNIALDTGENAVVFSNPDLPETRSEITLPLKSGDEVIGVLDMQSKDENAFSQGDIESFTILANQISIAIQNARSLGQAQRALQEASSATSQLTGIVWKGYIEKLRAKGYRYDGIRPEPVKGMTKPREDKNALQIPVQLRGQTIGRLKLKSPDASHKLTDDELAIIQSTADRVALAIDSARLLDEAQKRAAREALLSEISSKLSTSSQLDNILRDTVEELGETLKGSTVTFQLVNPETASSEEADDESSQSE